MQRPRDLEAPLVRGGVIGAVAGRDYDNEAPVDGVTYHVALYHRSLDVPPVCHHAITDMASHQASHQLPAVPTCSAAAAHLSARLRL